MRLDDARPIRILRRHVAGDSCRLRVRDPHHNRLREGGTDDAGDQTIDCSIDDTIHDSIDYSTNDDACDGTIHDDADNTTGDLPVTLVARVSCPCLSGLSRCLSRGRDAHATSVAFKLAELL